MARSFVLYSDFNCPFCYALNERLLALDSDAQLDWCGVQHEPELPVPMATAGPQLEKSLAAEVALLRKLAPEVALKLPRGKPNTERAIQAVIEFAERHPRRAAELKDRIYRAFWTEGADISDPEVLAGLAQDCGLPSPAFPSRSRDIALSWQQEWLNRGATGVPFIVRNDGETLSGLPEPDELSEFFTGP